MTELTQKQKKHLRALADKAYERELGRCIDKLFDKYQAWENAEITVWELNDGIHEFHDKIARDLYKTYTHDDSVFPVVFGTRSGAIGLSEVGKECLPEVETFVLYFEDRDLVHTPRKPRLPVNGGSYQVVLSGNCGYV